MDDDQQDPQPESAPDEDTPSERMQELDHALRRKRAEQEQDQQRDQPGI